MPLIKNAALTDDPWITVSDEAALPAHEAVIVSLERWRAEQTALTRRNGRLGLRLPSTSQELLSEIVERAGALETTGPLRELLGQAFRNTASFALSLLQLALVRPGSAQPAVGRRAVVAQPVH